MQVRADDVKNTIRINIQNAGKAVEFLLYGSEGHIYRYFLHNL